MLRVEEEGGGGESFNQSEEINLEQSEDVQLLRLQVLA